MYDYTKLLRMNVMVPVPVSPYLGFGSPSVSSAHHNGTGGGGIGGFPSNTPSTSSDSAGTVVAEQHQNGGGCVGGGGGGGRSSSGSSSGCHRLVIRDPFDDDEEEQQQQQHNQQQQHLLNNFAMPSSWFATSTPCRPPLLDGRTWMEQVRANGGGEQRPLVSAPGNGAPVAALPQYAFHMTPMQRQRLEAMYPPGTFSSTYFRTAPMPPPRALMPPQMPRFVLMPIRPGAVLPPQLAAAARTGPGQTPCIPVPLICGPGGLPMAVFPGGLVPIHPQMLVGAPPMMPGVGGAPPQIQTPHQQQQQAGTSSGVGKQQLNTSGGSTASSTATNTAATKESKPKRETIKVRKARQAAEKAAAEQQQLRQHEAAMAAAAAAAAVGMPQGPLAGVRSPCDGAVFPAAVPPPSMMMGGTPTPYGAMPAGNIMQQQQQQHQMMCHQQQQQQQQQLNPCLNPPHTPQQQQQDAIFKVPGRSPSSLKRASLPPPAPPPASIVPAVRADANAGATNPTKRPVPSEFTQNFWTADGGVSRRPCANPSTNAGRRSAHDAGRRRRSAANSDSTPTTAAGRDEQWRRQAAVEHLRGLNREQYSDQHSGDKESKPKRETIKVRKARQAAEKAAAEQQQLRQHEAAMAAAAAAAAVGMPQGPLAGVRSPCDGAVFPAAVPPPSMMMGGTPTPYGAMPAGNIMQQQQQQHQMMCHQQQQQLNPCLNPPHTPQQQQQDAIFKVPGRSPSSLKRASLPPPAPPPASMFPPSALMPMPEQRIQLNGQCQACRMELSDQHKGIQCTAIGQGCNRVFHWACADLTLEAFQEFCKDPRLEWICRECFAQKGPHCVFTI
uniref:PHD-type domain-containing protein n=1 Tax=Globodera pallida TaxID=36090 RepID=A0A183BIP9_GLOPA